MIDDLEERNKDLVNRVQALETELEDARTQLSVFLVEIIRWTAC